MPELPDLDLYVEAIAERIVGRGFSELKLGSPFVLRSVRPSAAELVGRTVLGVRRMGKRVVVELTGEHFIVVHLMIAGRFQWFQLGSTPSLLPKNNIALMVFASGDLLLREAGSKKRASIFLVGSKEELAEHERGGLEVLEATYDQFCEVLLRRNHTVKRSLTDPRILSGIGNAYSDEILHRAKLSPMIWTSRLSGEQLQSLYAAISEVLLEWRDLLRVKAKGEFPKKVTAFHQEMSVHGKYRQPCPVCGAPVQRILYAQNECNYCVNCQTKGRVLADRALSRLLGKDWPRTLEELEERRPTGN